MTVDRKQGNDAEDLSRGVPQTERPYSPPAIRRIGTVAELTEDVGNAGSPDGSYPLSNYGG